MRKQGSTSGRVVLISSDSDLQRQLRACLLGIRSTTGKLVTVKNRHECFAALTRIRPRLIVLDDETRHLDAQDLIRTLHQAYPEILILYLATQHTSELERAIRQLGVLYYTQKPPDFDVVQRIFAAAFTPVADEIHLPV